MQCLQTECTDPEPFSKVMRRCGGHIACAQRTCVTASVAEAVCMWKDW